MELVERHTHLAELDAALRDATAGRGSMVVITGEAGAGKTALVRHFTAAATPGGGILWGTCDELLTPRPFGPFRDIAHQLRGDVAIDSVGNVLDAVLAELGGPRYPAVVLVEDVHWADEATLDGIRFLGRRVGRLAALLVLTFRDDEVPVDHPLRVTLGAVPPDDIRRIALPRLSLRGVAELAGRDDVDELYRVSGGNPFFVTEMLAMRSESGEVHVSTDVPRNVQDAVMSRVGRLSETARACAEAAAVVPGRAERWLLDECGVAEGIDEAVRIGILRVDAGEAVIFSHELARRAVDQSLPSVRAQAINARVLKALIAHDADPARLTHHAVLAGDAAAIAKHAPVAARNAAALDAHREAVAHFRQALDNTDQYTVDELAALLHEYARECFVTERFDDAVGALRRGIALRNELGDQQGLGADLILLSEIQWFQGRGKDAGEATTRAIAVLEQEPASAALASAYAEHARLAMVDQRNDEAIEWGERAISLARERGDTELLANALNTVGMARWMWPPFDNGQLLESLELAVANRMTRQVPRAYGNLVSGYLAHVDDAQAGRYLEEGLAYCDTHDLFTGSTRLVALRSAWHAEQGRWPEAESDARSTLNAGDVTRVVAQTILGVLETRRGDPSAEATLQEAQRLADRTGSINDLVPIGLARAELAWLHGDLESAAAHVSAMFVHARFIKSPWRSGELALWLHRTGISRQLPPETIIEPYQHQIDGRWREAASAWAERGRLYAQADALADAIEPEPLLQSLEILDRLGAKPRAAMVRRQLADIGVTSVPRGPREATRTSPAGLTARQTEVLRLLADDLTYQEIADRLYLSVKTIDHHATAVRTKLGASTRAEAVRAARRLGILDSED
jgi:DNA-binding CsgD family transcriptional regulator/tetratricopeptide (TPR) repeat protein